jgi:flagellar hook protein FlgE
MSLFGAISTAVSGLTAQSSAFTNISDNIANSQTIGYKGVDTSFTDYLTSSTAAQNQSGAVGTTPEYENDVSGTVTQSSDPLALAISGQGFFNVSELSGSGASTFSNTQYYTRTGDFTLNDQKYLVNGSGEYLDGHNINPVTGQIQTGSLQPIQIDQNPIPAQATQNITYSATLPAGNSATSTINADPVQVIDASGASHDVDMSWTYNNAASNWTLNVTSPDSSPSTLGSATVTFGPSGSISSITPSGSNITTGSATDSLNLDLSYNGTPQTIALALGPTGSSDGVTTNASATSYTAETLTADGEKSGNYTGITMTSGGEVVASYDNSQTRVVAQIPLATFEAPDALQRQNGQAFTATSGSGIAQLSNVNQNGAGQLVTGSVESSNVDIATELTKLIAAQEAYGANAKMVTTGDQMVQTTLQMKQ